MDEIGGVIEGEENEIEERKIRISTTANRKKLKSEDELITTRLTCLL
jgi:hypothetical protein